MYSILCLFQQAKFAVSHVKWSSSSYNRWFTKFPREKAPSHSYFQIFKLPFATLWASPKRASFQLPKRSWSPIFQRTFMIGWVTAGPFRTPLLLLNGPSSSTLWHFDLSSVLTYNRSTSIIHWDYVIKQNSQIYSWNNQPARKSPGTNTTTSTMVGNLLKAQ